MDEAAKVYGRRDDVMARNIAGEGLLIPVRGELADLQRVFAVNPVAEAVWNLLDGKRTLAEISRQIEVRFEVTAEAAFADLKAFVVKLRELGLVTEP